MRVPFRSVTALFLALLAAAPRAGAQQALPAGVPGKSDEEFKRRWAKPAPEDKASAFRHLDAARPEALPLLYEGFRFPHWLVRGAAAEAAAAIPEGSLRSQLRLDLLTHEEGPVRGGLAYALALAPLAGDGEALAGALADRGAFVRRDAARGLRGLPSRGAIRALVAALAREADARVRPWILDTLRRMTGADEGPEPAAWAAWWEKRKDDPDVQPPPDAPPERREFAGVKLEVVTVPARRTPDGRKHPALFVLAPFGWTHDYYRPYLDPLRETFDVSYIRLPPVRELTGLSGYGDRIPIYPVDRLAKAFEALRKDRGVEKVVLLGEGASAWIAETYARDFPDRTAGLLLLNGWLDAASYGAALQRMADAGSADEGAVARSLMGLEPGDRDEREDRWMSRTWLTHRLMDRSDLLGHYLWTRTQDPQGFATVPPLRLDRRSRIETPTLFVFPAASPLSGHFEGPRVRDAFPKGLVAALEETRGLCWVDRHDELFRIVRGFVERYGLDR
jgi:pimeloyl-ACP methyl ester carboxylesterase